MKRWVWLLTMLVVGCGKPGPVKNTIKSKWSEAELKTTVESCVRGVDPSNSPDSRVGKYCQCVYQNASYRWTFAEYQSKRSEYEAVLDKEVAPGCETSALGAIYGIRRR